ncbi:membrane protein implicated in regulation of membrane protease activity [Rhodanobacter sp. TND4EL1]
MALLPWNGTGHAMLQLLNLFLVIFGVIAVGAGVASWRSYPPMALLLLALGLALVALAYVSDRRRERRADQRKRAAIQQRMDEFARRPGGSSQALKVRGGARYLLAGLLLTLMGMGVVCMASGDARHDVIPLVLGALLVPVGLLLLLRALAGVGQPALELDAGGFVTPLTGRIPWREVSGIALRTVAQRNGRESFFLMFRVKRFAHVAPRIHWTDRLLAVFHLGALAKGVVTVGLPSAKDPPGAIYAMARMLWKQSTRQDHDWQPQMSDEYNEAMRRAGELTARLEAPGAVEAALADSQRMAQAMSQMEMDMAVITAGHRRQLKKQRWVLAIFLALTVLVVAWPWIRRLLHS